MVNRRPAVTLLLAKRAMEFRILGPLEVVADDRVLPLGRGRQRALLAILLLRANQIVPTERLIDDLWSGEPPSTAPKMVQMYVAELRRALGKDVLRTASPGYTLRIEEHELDLDRFERLVGEARESGPTAAAALLRRALALWRGPPIGEFAYDPWAQTEIARLEELRLTALEDRFDADLATGRAGDIVGELEAVARNHPFRDRLSAQLMLALYRAGRQAEALQHYRRTRTELQEELGLEPSQLLQRLERAILDAGSKALTSDTHVTGLSGGTTTTTITDPITGVVTETTTPNPDKLALGAIVGSFAIISRTFRAFGGNFNVTLDALERKGAITTLAEPTLIALSGETASFLAGGEFPVPVVQNVGGGTAGGSAAFTVEWKPFGVSLAFTPTVLADGVINMIVAPEVSSIDPSASSTGRARNSLQRGL